MRRMLTPIALMIGLLPLSAGCRHVAGACDCEHTNYVRDVRDYAGTHGGCIGCGTNGAQGTTVAPPPPPPSPLPAPLPK
jgi:hypothetical protein